LLILSLIIVYILSLGFGINALATWQQHHDMESADATLNLAVQDQLSNDLQTNEVCERVDATCGSLDTTKEIEQVISTCNNNNNGATDATKKATGATGATDATDATDENNENNANDDPAGVTSDGDGGEASVECDDVVIGHFYMIYWGLKGYKCQV
jgi:hypothetical protein